jgi:hypothetical protein
MIQLLPEQVKALRELQDICSELKVDLVLIGAIAYKVWVSDRDRITEDMDAVVALDVEELGTLTKRLILVAGMVIPSVSTAGTRRKTCASTCCLWA